MAGTARILLTVLVIFSVGYVAEGWRWQDMFGWSTSRPSNCPSEDEETHVCSSLSSSSVNGTCFNIRCCTEEDSEEDEYEEETEEDSDDSPMPGHGHGHGHGQHGRRRRWSNRGGCSLCYSLRNCTVTVYKCRRYCCDGYTKTSDGRCVNKTSQIDCQNGGTAFDYFGTWTCLCTRNFTGTHCETPRCHCENGGQCRTGSYGQTYCDCRHGFTGRNCSQPICNLHCLNGGSCMTDGDAQVCMCPINYVGKYCEDYHANDKRCPVTDMRWSPPDCFDECNEYRDCAGDHLCCKEGCSRVCRPPKDATCTYNGRNYHVGATVRQGDPCKNCTCSITGTVMCSMVACARCPGATIQNTPPNGQCCPICEDKRRPPKFHNCPTWPVNVTTGWGSKTANLQPLASTLKATDFDGRPLNVSISPSYLPHCACANSRLTYNEVVAKAWDGYGWSTECRFKVYVLDQEPPRFDDCPNDIFVFEEEEVTWEDPIYSDNVGIYYKKCSKARKGQRYPAGVYNITYTVVDFDYNYAVCDFQIISTDADYVQYPEGLEQRRRDVSVAIIVAPIVGLAAVIIALVLMFIFCRRRRQARPTRRQRSTRRQQYDNNIYAVCGPPDTIKDMKLPHYTPPSNPPAYTPDMVDGEYTYISPPSYKEVDDTPKNVYDNPGYETMSQSNATTTENNDKEGEKEGKE